MKKNLLIGAILTLSACTYHYSPVVNTVTDLKAVDFSNIHNLRHGTACSDVLFGIRHGEETVKQAAINGNISKIEYVENTINGGQKCVIVYGR